MSPHDPETEPLQSKSESSFATDEPDQESLYSDKDASVGFNYLAHKSSSQRPFWRRSFLIPLMIHLVIIAVYSAVFLHAMRTQTFFSLGFGKTLYSPASDAVKYESIIYDSRLNSESAYVGPPSPHVDQAWTDLVENVHVKISGEDLRLINKTSIALPGEEDTYWGMLGVNHALHCLKRLRQDMYKEHYWPDLTPEEENMNRMHSSHCIEVLRQAAQCQGDVSIVTMFWGDQSAQPVADFDVPHTCVNWDAIVDWQKERSFNPRKPGLLVHPTLGEVYPDGKTLKLGVIGSSGE